MLEISEFGWGPRFFFRFFTCLGVFPLAAAYWISLVLPVDAYSREDVAGKLELVLISAAIAGVCFAIALALYFVIQRRQREAESAGSSTRDPFRLALYAGLAAWLAVVIPNGITVLENLPHPLR
jgi:nitrate reductase gamma subunit